MPTEDENVQYLYLVLTAGGPPTINMAAVSAELNLSAGATSKRWSRLKLAMEGGKNPGPSAYQFLWLCVKHSTRDKAMDWADIAAKCGTTAGAASKRYSRMKQAFEQSNAMPTMPSKPKSAGAAIASSPAATTPTPKRKRAPKKKTPESDDKFKPEHGDDGEEEEEEIQEKKPKRMAKPRATPKPKPKGKPTSATKEEPDDRSAGFLVSKGGVSNHIPGNSGEKNLPTPTVSASVNLTEATTLIKSDPEVVNAPVDGVQEPLESTNQEEHDDKFYDAQEAASEDEEVFAQNRIKEWLGEI